MTESTVVGGLSLDVPCVECSGTGVYMPQEWIDWIDKHNAARITSLPGEDEYVKENPYPTIPDEMPCPECEGSCYTLTRDGMALLAFLRRHSR